LNFNNQSSHQFLQSHRRKLLWATSLFVLYNLAGFLLLPWLVERQLINTLDERLQLSASVESIYFNPYT